MKTRLDTHLFDTGLVESLAKAQALIMAGVVLVDDKPSTKSGTTINPEKQTVRIKGQEHPWASRGGLKLAGAISHFKLNPQGAVAVDVGASTGGFTDVLLQQGALKVYAVDVGQGQLLWRLQTDARVVVLDKTNARALDTTLIPDAPDWIVCDASFISLKKVLPAALALAKPDATLLALIKPQFEAAYRDIGEGGIVRDAAVQQAVCEDIHEWLESEMHWQVRGLMSSPIFGAKGNTEFLVWAVKN
jgi:23S rRNA (cytidine1920-2'-O)/16S rRNA (cytidine1409-2'-O)-methyltransferase